MSIMILAAIASVVALFIMIIGPACKLREAYKELPYYVQGSSGSCSGFNTYYEVAFYLYKIKMKGRLNGTLSSYSWKKV